MHRSCLRLSGTRSSRLTCKPVVRPPQDYDAALELQPKCAIALYRKGQVLSAQKKIEVGASP